MAEQRNGTIAASYAQYHSAVEDRIQSFANFLPTVTPTYVYNSDRSTFRNGGIYGANQTEGSGTSVTADWQILDLGERNFNFLSARRSEDARYYLALQAVRQTVFNVQQEYYETLRAQELSKVADAQVQRSSTILQQTQDSVAAGAIAKIAIYQATADYANAKVQVLASQNLVATNGAQLKGLIGYDAAQTLPSLQKVGEPVVPKNLPSLDTFLTEGIKDRPDLISERLDLQSIDYSKKYQERLASLRMNLSIDYTQSITPYPLQSRFATLTFTYPLFDGGSSRAAARSVGYQEVAAQATLDQAIRSAKAEIEADYLTFTQDGERLSAAQEAETAAQENYTATLESQKLGSSTLIDVLTAQVSLVTADSDLISAEYDYDEAELGLRLATGRPLYGQPLT